MDDSEIRANGILALNRALGPTGALRFLTLLAHEPTDYVKLSRELYKNQTVDEIIDRAKAGWRG